MTTRAQTVTILFTDLVNSTELLQRAGDEQAQRIFAAHHLLLSQTVAAHGGEEVKWLGDGLMVAFQSAADAVRCAIAMQQGSRRPAAGSRLDIRAGLHVGEAMRSETDYFGTSVVIARRLCDRAGAGQILASDLVVRLLESHREFTFEDLGSLSLKGISEPVGAAEVLHEHDPLAMLERTPFIGRTDQMRVLERALDAASGGRGGVAMLVGEPGIGKTRLAEEFRALAMSAGVTVLWGRCFEGEWAPPFSPFAEALRAYAAGADDDELRTTLGGDASLLARVMPSLRDRLPGIPEPAGPETEGERYRLLEAVSGWTRRLASLHPLVLVLDDLHWADAGTAAMLRHVAREARACRVLLIGTYRDVEVTPDHLLAPVLANLRRDTTFEQVSLSGLAVSEVGQLLDVIAEQNVPDALSAAIASETAGNPLFVREVLLYLVQQGTLVREDGAWVSHVDIAEVGIREGVRDVIGRRIARLGDEARELLTAVCPITGGFTLQALRGISGLDETRMLDLIDEVVAARLMTEHSNEDVISYDFPHALIRHTLYQPLTASRRAALHQRIAGALEGVFPTTISDYYEQIANHYEQAAMPAKAVEYLLKSADKARAGYLNVEALAFYGRAQRWLAGDSSEAWSVGASLTLHEGIGDVLLLIGKHEDAQAQLATALSFATTEPAASARLRRKIAGSLVTQRRYEEAVVAFDAAEEALGDVVSRGDDDSWYEWVQIQIDRIWMHYWQSHVAEMTAVITASRSQIEQRATQLQLGKFFQALTGLGLRRERYYVSQHTRELAEAAILAVLRAGDSSELAFTHFMLGFTALWMDDFKTAEEQFSIALDWGERTGDVTVQSRVLTYQAVLKRKLGDIEGVQECVDRVLPVATQGQLLEYVGTARANLAWIAWRHGRLDDAAQLAQAALETWTRLPISYAFRWTALLPALALALDRERLSDAREDAAAMLEPSQQRLSDSLTQALEATVNAPADDAEVLQGRISDALHIAKQQGYL